MAIESVTCPNCGATGIQIDTSREHSFCSYCGSTLKTKDVLHLDVDIDSARIRRFKRNAERSFQVEEYCNAKEDWKQVLEIDCTDYESYWGIVRCDMEMWGALIELSNEMYTMALTYAPSEMKVEYERQVEAHNARMRKIREAQKAKDLEDEQKQREIWEQKKAEGKKLDKVGGVYAFLWFLLAPALTITAIVLFICHSKSYGWLFTVLALLAWVAPNFIPMNNQNGNSNPDS